jgi:hypothetical protein
MAAGNRIVVGMFALAVAAALAAVAWLVLHTTPPTEPGRTGTEKPAVRPVPPPRPDRPPPERRPPGPSGRQDHAKPRSPVVLEVGGEVRGPDDAPVPGAEVAVLSSSAVEALQPSSQASAEKVPVETLRELFDLEPEDAERTVPYSGVPAVPADTAPGKEVARGTTGADGKFLITTPSRGPFRLEARKAGLGQSVASDVLAGGPPVVMKLGPAAALTGRVTNGVGGAPVEGAVVIARSGGVSKGTTAGPDGAFSVPDLPPGKYSLTAGAPGFAPVTLPVEAPSAAPVDVVLGGGYAARITVVKMESAPQGPPPPRGAQVARGTPEEGALVVLMHRSTQTYRSGITGPDGTVRIERLGAGNWRIAVRRDGFSVGHARDIDFKTGSPPEESREARLYPAVETPIRVLDEAGSPVRNARVYTGGTDEDYDERRSKLVGRTDDEGVIRFTFDDGVPWKSVVWVVPESGGAVVRVEPEDTGSGQEVKVVARPGRAVQGTVTDAKGKALKGVQVRAEVTDDEKDVDISMNVYTDEKGAYRFPTLPFGDLNIEADLDGEYETQDVDAENRENPLTRDFKLNVEEKK